MTLKNRKFRLLAALLALVMVITMIPAGIVASGTGTVWGEEETVKVGESLNARENNLNKGWKFYLGDNSSASNQNFDDSAWDDVDLPHDFSIIQNFTTSGEAESGFLPGGTGWYRKTLVMPEEAAGKTFLLNFDGVYMHAYVYVNGTAVGEHHYGYTNFAIDITEHLVCDGVTENVIAVKAVNNIPSSRWYSGSGIYRDVTLFVLDPVHVDLNGVYVTTPDIASGNGTVKVEVDVVNDGTASADVTVKNTVYAKGTDTALATAESTVTVEADTTGTATNAPVVSSPALWSTDAPNLYTVKTEILVGGEVVDTYETEFGFRWFTFSRTGFALNGENLKLNGVCLHHDQGALGAAAYYDAMYRQLSIMKDMGVNAIRTSHNPADEDFIAICNELGLLVIEEAFDGLVDAKNSNSNDFSSYFEASVDTNLYGATSGMTNAEYAARSMVKRDRNAPSVFAWSFGNEIQEGTSWANAGSYDDICASFITWVNDEDGTRIVTSGDNNRGGSSDLVNVLNTIINADGVVGFNYANSIDTLSSLASTYGGTHECIIASETASHTNSRGVYTTQASNSTAIYHQTSYDTSAVSWGITAHDSIYNTYNLDNVAGEFVWTGFDYIGEPTPFNGTGTGSVSGSGAIPNSSYFGIVETTGFEKDSYYLYRSQWNKAETTLHLVTAWDSDNYILSDSKTPVWVYSNAPVVKLYRVVDGTTVHVGTATRVDHTSDAGHTYYTYTTESNDSSLCTTSSGSDADGLYAVFNVTYADGTLYAKAFEADGTTEITLSGNCGQHTVTTPGTVTTLTATPNTTTVEADGTSLVYIEVDVTDGTNLDTTATNNITFTLTGPGVIVGVDNGNQATTAKYQNSSVKDSDTSAHIAAYAGKALVIVRTTEEAGTITVTVSSDGLTDDSVVINATASEGDSGSSETDLASYAMVKDYSVKVGTTPTLDTSATGTLVNGSNVTGTIVWYEIDAAAATTAGDYVITGTLTFTGYDPIKVTARLHVIADVIAMRNISTATTSGVVPTLPTVVNGVLADGTVTGEFTVEWDEITATQLTADVGTIVTVNGTATVLGSETLPVTCTIRVAEAVNTESINVAPQANSLSQDIVGSDNLYSIYDGETSPEDSESTRWSNYGNRYSSDTATITMTWATAQMLSDINLYYRLDSACKKPESVVFSYSLNGTDFVTVGATEAAIDQTINYGAAYSYALDKVINPVALKITLTQQGGTSSGYCVGLYEVECMTYAATLEYNTSANLSSISVDGTAIDGFAADTLEYSTAEGTVTAATEVNAGITVLPIYQGVVRILTVSEDGSAAKTYAITQEVSSCEHSWDNGVITQQPTASAAGVKTYTCSLCGTTKTEGVPYEGPAAPSVSLEISANDSGILVFQGTVDDYADVVTNYTLVKHGILYMPTATLGSQELTVNTAGRIRVIFSDYTTEGSFVYNLTAEDGTVEYTVRAFLVYVDPQTGATVTVYSQALVGSCDSLK